MKASCSIASIAAFLLLLTLPAAVRPMAVPPQGEITLLGTLNRSCIPHEGGTVYLELEINVRNFPTPDVCRHPLNISVVLDRSGSMADDRKIDYAKKAIHALLDRLTNEDYISVVVYDDQIDVLVPTQRVRDRARLKALVDEIEPRGSTNLGGGMTEGFRQIERNYKANYVNRVILLSDGIANTGIVTPRELNRIASRYREKSISLTTIGVGLDYNESLMLGLAEHGGGNYYFIENPRQLASLFENELNGLAVVVAQNAHLELTTSDGVTVADVVGCERTLDGRTWLVPIGDLYAKDSREVTVELNVPEGAGMRHIVSGILKYADKNGAAVQYPTFSTSITYTDDVAELSSGKNGGTQAKVDVALTSRNVSRAVQALDAGDRKDAAKQLDEARNLLQSAPASSYGAAGAAIVGDQLRRLEEYSKEVADDTTDLRKAKKAIHFNNYKALKKK